MVKLYLDSRARSYGTHENFTIALPTTLDLKVNHIALLDTVCIPVTWKSISAHNQKMYLCEVVSGTEHYRVVSLLEGNYSAVNLADAFQTTLNTGRSLPNAYSVSYNFVANKIEMTYALTGGGSYSIWGADY